MKLLSQTSSFVNSVRSGLTRAYRIINDKQPLLLVCGSVALKDTKVGWPDMNFPGEEKFMDRLIYDIDYTEFRVQLDGPEGPWFHKSEFPEGVLFCNPIKNK
jgi:hypothetical protein